MAASRPLEELVRRRTESSHVETAENLLPWLFLGLLAVLQLHLWRIRILCYKPVIPAALEARVCGQGRPRQLGRHLTKS